MRATVVSALLLSAVALAAAAGGLAGDTSISFPKPGTGRLSCTLPVKNIRCSVDTRSGFVAGVKLGYGAYGEWNVCWIGNSFQTTWDMSPVNYVAPRCTYPNGFNKPPVCTAPQNVPTWSSNKLPISDEYLMPYGSLVTQVLELTAPNPYGDKFGDIAALVFRYTNEQLAEQAAAGEIPEPYANAVCGNAEYASAYLFPGSQPAPAPVTLKAVYNSPLTGDDTPSFLGSFYGKCFTRGTGYLGGDPNTSSKGHIVKIMKACFTKLAHVVPVSPRTPIPPPPEPQYNWDVPYMPCFGPHKVKKGELPTSIECAESGAHILTGKYGVIMKESSTGKPIAWELKEDGKTFHTVEAAGVFLGTDPDQESLDAIAEAEAEFAAESE